MQKTKAFGCIALLISAVLFGAYRTYVEYSTSAAWAAGEFMMDALAHGVRRTGPLDSNKISDMSFDVLFAPRLMGIYERDRAYVSNPSFGKNGGIAILYWLPHDPKKEIVFVTSGPMRRPFSQKYYHWVVTLDGTLRTISCSEFLQIIARSR